VAAAGKQRTADARAVDVEEGALRRDDLIAFTRASRSKAERSGRAFMPSAVAAAPAGETPRPMAAARPTFSGKRARFSAENSFGASSLTKDAAPSASSRCAVRSRPAFASSVSGSAVEWISPKPASRSGCFSAKARVM
jgi:hypothetical protein